MAQPNMANLAASMQNILGDLNVIVQETARLPNIPAVAEGNAILQQLTAIQNQLTNLTDTVTANHATAQTNNMNLINTITNLTNTVTTNHATAQTNNTNLTNTVTNLTNTITNLTNIVRNNHNGTTATLATLSQYVKNGPMRAANAAGGNDGPLHGPNGPLPAPITTCDSLLTATVAQLDVLNQYLGGIAGYPVAGLLVQKCAAIGDF